MNTNPSDFITVGDYRWCNPFSLIPFTTFKVRHRYGLLTRCIVCFKVKRREREREKITNRSFTFDLNIFVQITQDSYNLHVPLLIIVYTICTIAIVILLVT